MLLSPAITVVVVFIGAKLRRKFICRADIDALVSVKIRFCYLVVAPK